MFYNSSFIRSLNFGLFLSKTMENIKTIGTHDGTFHCDEVLACYMLKLLSPNASVVRSRNEKVLKTCDIVVDVGGVYDPEKKLFDHHQREFNHSGSSLVSGKPWTIKLSSAGLVYCHYGKEIITKVIENIEESALNSIFHIVYEKFIQEIDAVDNGIPICEGKQLYHINTHLSARVKNLNASWKEPSADTNNLFDKAMEMVGEEFKNVVIGLYDKWWPARVIVLEAINNRHNLHSSGEIIELEKFCPWITHLFEIEKEMKLDPFIKYVIFPASHERTDWRVQSVPIEENSYLLRVPLKEEWRGLREETLSKISGIKGCIFVHANGFIGSNKTRIGALQMAKDSLI